VCNTIAKCPSNDYPDAAAVVTAAAAVTLA